MGHLGNSKELYKKLTQKLDSYPIGVIEDEKMDKFLHMLYTPQEAELIIKMPLKPSDLTTLVKKTGTQEETLKKELDRMAGKGIVFKVTRNSTDYYGPIWSVPGFVEMTLMKVRDDIPQKEIAKLTHQMEKDPHFAQEIFRENTQFGRALIDDEVAGDTADILPYELATEAVKNAKKFAVSMCYCRHKEEHAGKPCKYPSEVCLSLNVAAEFVIEQKFGREIDKKKALDILETASKNGLMHIGDNVQNNLSFICNCCKCCCGILGGYHNHGIFPVAVASSFTMITDKEKCIGCQRCIENCHIDAITLVKDNGKSYVKIDKDICLGCGICYRFCSKGALSLKKRAKKVTPPETDLEKLLMIAIERGKLQKLMFDDVNSYTQAFLRFIFGIVLKRKIVKKILLLEGSRKGMVKLLKKMMGKGSQSFILE